MADVDPAVGDQHQPPDLRAVRRRYQEAAFALDNYPAEEEIAASVEDVPALLSEVERLRAQRDAALAIANRWLTESLPEPNRWIYANGAGHMIRRALGAED